MTPHHLSLRGRVGAYSVCARHGHRETTTKARETFLSRFEHEVDPGGVGAMLEEAHLGGANLREVYLKGAYDEVTGFLGPILEANPNADAKVRVSQRSPSGTATSVLIEIQGNKS